MLQAQSYSSMFGMKPPKLGILPALKAEHSHLKNKTKQTKAPDVLPGRCFAKKKAEISEWQ